MARITRILRVAGLLAFAGRGSGTMILWNPRTGLCDEMPEGRGVCAGRRPIITHMPTPTNERHRLEHELREELPARLAAYQQELASGSADKVRREQIEWQIRRVEARMATVRAWLAENAPAAD
jgi:hypothetical protein